MALYFGIQLGVCFDISVQMYLDLLLLLSYPPPLLPSLLHSKVSHPNITKLLAVTLTSEPTSLILVSAAF